MAHLAIFVEGPDDERFFRRVVEPLLKAKPGFEEIHLVRNAELRKQTVARMLSGFKALGDEYLFVADFDDAPCVSAKKAEVQSIHPALGADHIRVVRREIESWYAAGLPDADVANCGGADGSCNEITKEGFRQYCQTKRAMPATVMAEIVQNYDITRARQLNASLNYVLEKALL